MGALLGRAGAPAATVLAVCTVVGVLAGTASAAPSFARHYELATPPDKLGQPTRNEAISPDGLAVRFTTVGGNGLPGTESQDPYLNGYLARRTGSRWEYLPMNPPLPQGGPPALVDTTTTLDRQLFLNTTDGPTNAVAFFLRRAGEAATKVSPDIVNRVPPDVEARPVYQGASADLSHILFMAKPSEPYAPEHAYLPSDPPPDPLFETSPQKLYESVAGSPSIRRVDVDDSGTPIGACGGGQLGSDDDGEVPRLQNAISTDGRRIVFSARPDCEPLLNPGRRRLYARTDGSSTTELSASECNRTADPSSTPPVTECSTISADARFESASSDGRRVFFTTTDQLVDGDTDSTRDMYAYDFDAAPGARLIQISAGDETDATPGSGADVAGVVRAADEGSRIFFVARGVLTTDPNSEGAVAEEGANNFYLVDTANSRTTFVGTLAAGDSNVFDNNNGQAGGAQLADPAGRYLVFTATARLTADDNDSARDVYLFDADTAELVRVSKARAGFGSDGNAESDAEVVGPNYATAASVQAPSTGRSVTTDGSRVVFTTGEALEADDVNDGSDVYEWHDGQVGLVSDGVDPDSTLARSYAGPLISADGSAVAFTTFQRLDPERDTDQASDVYVARLGADVDPLPPGPPPPCVGPACQGEPPPPPQVPVAATLTFQGPGNAAVPVGGTGSGKVALSKPKKVAGSRATLKINAPAAGRIAVSGSGVKATKKTIAKGGEHTVTVALSSRALKTLKKRKSVKVKVKVAFTPTTGAPSSASVALTFGTTSSTKGRS